MTHLNQLEKAIISLLMDIIYEYEGEPSSINSIENLSDNELTKVILESHLRNNYECKLGTLYKTIDRVRGFAGDPMIPVDLFAAAMEFAVDSVRWELISVQENIQEQINELRNSLR
jgi:hypothetical protein